MGNDPEASLQGLKEVGVITSSGDVDWDKMERLAHFVKNARSTGGSVKFHDLKEYVEGKNS